MNYHLILKENVWKLVDMPVMPLMGKCSDYVKGGCHPSCICEHGEWKVYNDQVQSAIDNAVIVESSAFDIDEKFRFWKAEYFPIPEGYQVEIIEVPCDKGNLKCEDACYGSQSGVCNHPEKRARLVKI